MDPLLCFPDPLPVELQKVLAQAGYPFVGVTSAEARTPRARRRLGGAVVSAVEDREAAIRDLPDAAKAREPLAPLLLIIDHEPAVRS
jgi:hypothetical protein